MGGDRAGSDNGSGKVVYTVRSETAFLSIVAIILAIGLVFVSLGLRQTNGNVDLLLDRVTELERGGTGLIVTDRPMDLGVMMETGCINLKSDIRKYTYICP